MTSTPVNALAAGRPYAAPVDVQLHAFPSSDAEFRAFVEAAWEGLPEPRSLEALQKTLRERYPTAVVTAQEELARHGDPSPVWYAFRTAAMGPSLAAEAPADTDAWAILDDDRRFVEVSPGLAEITETPARRMVGHQVEDFSNPADPTIRDDIARLWREFQASGALASTVRFNFADGRPRELGYRLEANAGGPGRHRLTVWVLPGG